MFTKHKERAIVLLLKQTTALLSERIMLGTKSTDFKVGQKVKVVKRDVCYLNQMQDLVGIVVGITTGGTGKDSAVHVDFEGRLVGGGHHAKGFCPNNTGWNFWDCDDWVLEVIEDEKMTWNTLGLKVGQKVSITAKKDDNWIPYGCNKRVGVIDSVEIDSYNGEACFNVHFEDDDKYMWCNNSHIDKILSLKVEYEIDISNLLADVGYVGMDNDGQIYYFSEEPRLTQGGTYIGETSYRLKLVKPQLFKLSQPIKARNLEQEYKDGKIDFEELKALIIEKSTADCPMKHH